jgi:hypothetical protein
MSSIRELAGTGLSGSCDATCRKVVENLLTPLENILAAVEGSLQEGARESGCPLEAARLPVHPELP